MLLLNEVKSDRCVCYLVIIYSKFPRCLLDFNTDTHHLNISMFDRTSKRTKPQRLSHLWHSMRALFCGIPNPNSQVELWMQVKHLRSPEITWMIWDLYFYFKWINDLKDLEWRRGNIKPKQNKNFSQTDTWIYNNSFTLLSHFPSVSHTPQWEDKNYYLRLISKLLLEKYSCRTTIYV